MNAKIKLWALLQQMHGMKRPGAGHHYGSGGDYALRQCAEDSSVEGVAQSKIIGVYDQQADVGWVTYQAIGLAFGQMDNLFATLD